MADLNRQLIGVTQKTSRLKDDLIALLRDYEGLFHEANGLYLAEERTSDNAGLEDFYMLIQTIRRNRDLIGSVLKGISNIRPTDRFKFVEEDIPEPKLKPKTTPKKEKKMKGYMDVSPIEGTVSLRDVKEESGVING